MCSFKGIKLKSKHKYDYLPRLLSLLTFHNQEGTVTRAFENWSELIPPSSWIPWIPHLLLALQTSTLSNNTCAKILKELAISFPQVCLQSFEGLTIEVHMSNSLCSKFMHKSTFTQNLVLIIKNGILKFGIKYVLPKSTNLRSPISITFGENGDIYRLMA